MRRLTAIWLLGLKELMSLRRDVVLLVFMTYTYTVSVYLPAKESALRLRNATIAVVDEDRSILSRRIIDAIPEPWFLPPVPIAVSDIDRSMDRGDFTFVIDIPPNFARDVLAGDRPILQILVDATAMSQAGIGSNYLSAIIGRELASFLRDRAPRSVSAPEPVVRVRYNPNLTAGWFEAPMQIINMTTVLAVVLTGAALVRERERGTVDHLLVLPIGPFEIMTAKVWANGLVIILASTASLLVVVRGALGIPIQGSIPLFVLGQAFYLFAVTSLGIVLATVARTMAQLGLLFIPVVIPMFLLSGSYTPVDSMPQAVRTIVQVSPTTHFVAYATAVLYRGADLTVAWRPLMAMAAIGAAFFLFALSRFRRTVSAAST